MTNALTRRGLVSAAPAAILATAGPAVAFTAQPASDPVLSQIELHKALLHRANTMPGQDDDPAFLAAVEREEAAIQALGDMIPATIAGAAAQLAYMAEIEGGFAKNGSPLLQTVLSVAKGLASLDGRSAHA